MVHKSFELRQECLRRGIAIESSFKKKDCLSLLSRNNVPKSLPFSLDYRLSLESLMLSKSFKELSVDKQIQIIKTNPKEFISEIKYTGSRALMIYHPDEGFTFYSRDIDIKTFIPKEYTNNILIKSVYGFNYPKDFKRTFPKPFVLDVEILFDGVPDTSEFYSYKNEYFGNENNPVSTFLNIKDKGYTDSFQKYICSLRFIALDLLYYSEDKTNQSLLYRSSLKELLCSSLNKYGISISPSKVLSGNILDNFNYAVSNGYEGIVLKNKDKPYLTTTSRRYDTQIKLKKGMLSKIQNGLYDIDVFVKEIIKEKNKYSIKCGIFIENDYGKIEHIIGICKDFPKELVSDDLLNKVFSVNCFEILPSLSFKKVLFNSYDPYKDKTSNSCIVLNDTLLNIRLS